MYMESIVARKTPVSSTRRRMIGSVLVALSVMLMVPWLVAMTTYAAAVFGVRTLLALPRTLIQAIDHAGARAN